MSAHEANITEAPPEAVSACPNPLCSGLVSATDSTCKTCGHELSPCSSCGKLMSINFGRCGKCGFRLPKKETAQETTEQPKSAIEPAPATASEEHAPVLEPVLVVRFEAAREAVSKKIAEAYYKMATAESDMAKAAELLEQLRTLLMSDRDALKIWKALNKEAGAADTKSRKAIVDLRKWFERELFKQIEKRLGEFFAANPETGWTEWLRHYAEALTHWRLPLCQKLVLMPFPFPEEFRAQDFKRVTRLIFQERWTQVYRLFSYLEQHEFINPLTRARLLIPVGQIHLYFFSPLQRALPFFERAATLAPNHPRCLAALGDYHLQLNDTETATGFFQRGISAGSDEPESYAGMGDIASKRGNFEEARTWYQEAINKAGGHTFGYTQLLRLYGRPEFIDQYESQIAALAERAMAVDETSEYKIYLDVGDAYFASKRFDQAHASYERAIHFEPKRLDGYVWKGFAYLEEGETRYEAAQQAFLKAIELAPDAYNGYWGMGQLSAIRQHWDEATEWYAKVAECQPELKSGMLVRIGDMHLQLQEYERAEAVFIEAFELDGSAGDALLTLADDYYRKYDSVEDARRLHERIRQLKQLKGEPSEAVYFNRMGNISYFEGNYAEAARHYKNAIDLDSQQPIYHTNLSDTHRLLKNFDAARSSLSKALDLDGNRQEYDAKLAVILNDEGNEFYGRGQYDKAIESYSEAEKLSPTTPRYPANRALALKQLIPTSQTAVEVLDRAIGDTQKAIELAHPLEDPSALLKDFSDQLAELQRQRAFALLYGANSLALDPSEKVNRLYLDLQLLLSVVNADKTSISAEFMALIHNLHSNITEKSGLRLTNIIIYPLEPADTDRVDYAFELRSERMVEGKLDLEKQFALCSAERLAKIHLPTDEPGFPEHLLGGYWLSQAEAIEAANHEIDLLTPHEYLVRCVEAALSEHLDKVCGHQEVANTLAQFQTSFANQILEDPQKIHELTLALKRRLRHGDPINDFTEFCRNFNDGFLPHAPEKLLPKSEPVNGKEISYKSLQVGLSAKSSIDRIVLGEGIAKVQTEIFNRLGIIFPQPSIVDREDLEANEVQIEGDGQEILRVLIPGPDELAVSASVDDLQARYPAARSLFNPFSGVSWTLLPVSEGLENELNEMEYSAVNGLGYILGLVLMEAGTNPALFLTTELLDHYLATLQPDFGALLAVARHYFSQGALMEFLRSRLRANWTIRNMPAVLELLLSDPTTETAGVH